MVRYCGLLLFLGVFGFSVQKAAAGDTASPEPIRPNILYVYVDDMGWGAIGPNGQDERRAKDLPSVRTPNIDRLARQGVNFTRGYGCTVCSPARSSQQSGFHQGHTFADRNDPDNAKKAMRADDILMGDALARAGYVTGYWGKWGYGGSKDQVNPTIQNVQTLPTSHGYQHVLTELHHVRAHTFFQPTLWSAPAAPGAKGGLELVANSLVRFDNPQGYPSSPAHQKSADYPATAYCDDSYAFAALDFVRTQGQNYNQSGQPFFALLAVQVPHAPFDEVATLPNWDEAYVDDKHFAGLAKQTQQWAAMVTRIDTHLGNLMAALEDPNGDGDPRDSIADETLVVFQSDNGGPSGKSNVELDANGGLRGVKGTIYEGGIRVPLVMRWPAHLASKSTLKAGTQTDMIVDVSDLCPTFCELAGTEAPLGADGVSIAPTLLSRGYQRRREFVIHEAGAGQSIIRGKHKLIRTKRTGLALYDLERDQGENTNLAEEQPEIVQELNALLLGERVGEPRGFANTYHRWTGAKDANASDAENWSDYRYENDGITYMTDNGAPQVSWVARMNSSNGVAQVNSSLEFLALQIGDDDETKRRQTLRLDNGVRLTGRNEVRIRDGGTLDSNGAIIHSLRWVDIGSGGVLQGNGEVDASLFNAGSLALEGSDPGMMVQYDYHQLASGTLAITFTVKANAGLRVVGDAHLAGTLELTVEDGHDLQPGQSTTVVTAKRLTGTFANEGNNVTASNGTRFSIGYSDTSVTLTAQ